MDKDPFRVCSTNAVLASSRSVGGHGGIPLLVLPAQLGDEQKGETMKVKPKSMNMATPRTFAHLKMQSLLLAKELMLSPARLQHF